MQVALWEHKYMHPTHFGEVERSLRQYRVFMRSERTGKMMHIGYIGTHPGAKFLPISGFPNELRGEVCNQIQILRAEAGHFDAKPQSIPSPPSADDIRALMQSPDEDEDEDE